MANTTIKNSTLFYHDWLKAFEKMTDEDVGKITKALLLLDSQGIRTPFDDNMILDIIYSQFAAVVERNRARYEEACERKSEAAKRREAQKTTIVTNLHNCDDRIGEDKIGEDRIREDVPPTTVHKGAKNRFKNFDEREYSAEVYEKVIGGNQ